MTKHERDARLAAAMMLHAIARQYFGYPPLEDSWWYLPTIRRWQPWHPLPSTPPRTRAERRLIGALVVPSLVRFRYDPGNYLSAERWERFALHLQVGTGSRWVVDSSRLHLGFAEAERTPYEVRYTNGEGTTHLQRMPAPTPLPRERLFVQIWRGLRGEWDHELSTDYADALPASEHSAEQGARVLEVPTVRKALPRQAGSGQSFGELRAEIEGRDNG